MKKERKGQGSKLNRTEIVQFRLDPRLRFALELMAKNEHRTVSSFIEKLVDEAIDTHQINLLKTLEEIQAEQDGISINDMQGKTDITLKSITLTEALKQLWHIDEEQRFILMAFFAPHLFTYEEEVIWDFIKRTDYYWTFYYVNAVNAKGKAFGKMLTRIFDPSGVVWDRLKSDWPLLKEGQIDIISEIFNNGGEDYNKGKIVERPEGNPEDIVLYRSSAGIIGVEKTGKVKK